MAEAFLDETVEAQFVCHDLGLLPEWPGPNPNKARLRYDRSGEHLRQLELALQEGSSA